MKKLIKRFSFPFTFWVQKDERSFLTFIIVAFLTAMFVTPYPQIAMWVGFLFAAYAAVANDSIQTLGTLLLPIKIESGGCYGFSLVVYF